MDCWCVEKESGVQIEGSRVKFGENPQLNPESFSCDKINTFQVIGPCAKAAAEATAFNAEIGTQQAAPAFGFFSFNRMRKPVRVRKKK